MDGETRAAVERALGAAVERSSPISGGSINRAFRLRLEDGRDVFAKTNESADGAMFPTEARGLAFLAEARALRVPDVLAVSDGTPGEPAFLVLEYLEPGRPARGFDEALGRGLAALHRFGAPSFGLPYDNFIGSLPQGNRSRPTWPEFYAEERLGQELARPRARSLLGARVRRDFDRLFSRLPELLGPEEPPSRLHGDLWGGNLHSDPFGAPVLVDPAVYGGHREVDLAMIRLFGGFSERTFAAYDEAFPLAPGAHERVDLYQLYPLLVHVNLFGGSYAAQVASAVSRYV
ncbi:MAG TPA: fructosamine kinase family protein [Polyangiaceae bacterium]|nr:fructosamine kinase family protein [Polyangiaceae bacterium]